MTLSGFFTAAEWGLTLAYNDDYRGHARGFHFYFNVALAGALIIAEYLESPRRFRWVPPGLLFYLAYVGLSFVSIINAPAPLYTWMAAFKALEVIVIFMAAYHFLKTIEDLRFFLTTFAIVIGWELLAVLKLKYFNHQYQVMGTFEHQNALSMYTNLIGLVFLSVALGPKQPRSGLYLAAFIGCVWIVECTLSRGGLGVLAASTAGLMVLGLIDKVTVRRVLLIGGLSLVAGAGLLLSINTIINRFSAYYNQDSVETRRLLNIASREMLRDFPMGIGWNNFGVTINPPYPYGNHIDKYFKDHNEATGDSNKGIVESHYYLLLSETGWQGYLAYLVMISYFLWCNLRGALYFRNHLLGALSLGIGMGCLANYAQSLLERVLTQPRNMMLWLLLLAVTARIETWRRMAKRRRKT